MKSSGLSSLAISPLAPVDATGAGVADYIQLVHILRAEGRQSGRSFGCNLLRMNRPGFNQSTGIGHHFRSVYL